jgi:hypothetical protein
VYAYLKEEIVNTPDTPSVKYLKTSCPKLMAFVNFMESKFEGVGLSGEMGRANQIKWRRIEQPLEI